MFHRWVVSVKAHVVVTLTMTKILTLVGLPETRCLLLHGHHRNDINRHMANVARSIASIQCDS